MQLLQKDKVYFGITLGTLAVSVALFAYTSSVLSLVPVAALLYFLIFGLSWKTAYWIFLFTVPPSTQIDLDIGSSLTLPDQPLMWCFLGLFIFLFAHNPKILPKWWWKDELVMITALQFICLIIAVIYSKVFFLSVKYLISKTWIMACYFLLPILIFREKKDFVIAFKVMMASILTTVIIILIHHALLNFRFDKVQVAMTDLYYNHVDYSSVVSMFLPLIIVGFPLTKNWTKFWRFLYLMVIAIFIAGVFFSYARAAVLAVIFSIAIGIAIRIRKVNWVMPAFYTVLTIALIYMIKDNKFLEFRPDYGNTYMHKDFSDHMLATFKGKDMSSMERFYRWIAALRMSRDEPITGYGPHGFYYNYQPYAISMFRTYVSANPEGSTTHNYYLYMLTEQGWPAMLLYALLIPAVFAKAQRTFFRFKDKYYRTVTIGLAMTIAAGFINNFFSELIETHKVGALFYIPIALLIILDKKSKEEAMVNG